MCSLKNMVFGWVSFPVYESISQIEDYVDSRLYVITYKVVKSVAYIYCFLYWKALSFDFVKSQVYALRRLFIVSGFVHMWGARHWKRCSKIGRF